jgi:uncharacterized protein YkwD
VSHTPVARRSLPAAAAVVLGALLVLILPTPPPAVAGSGSTGETEAVIAQRLAEARASAGVSAIGRSSDLDAVARDWSRRQAADGQMKHNPNLRDQVQPARSWYENVGHLRGVPSSRSYRDAGARLHEMWMASDSHRANMLRSPLTDYGVGVASSGDTIYATVVFRERSGEAPASSEPSASASSRPPEPAPEPAPEPEPAPAPAAEPAPDPEPTSEPAPEPAAAPPPPEPEPGPEPEPVVSAADLPEVGLAEDLDASTGASAPADEPATPGERPAKVPPREDRQALADQGVSLPDGEASRASRPSGPVVVGGLAVAALAFAGAAGAGPLGGSAFGGSASGGSTHGEPSLRRWWPGR